MSRLSVEATPDRPTRGAAGLARNLLHPRLMLGLGASFHRGGVGALAAFVIISYAVLPAEARACSTGEDFEHTLADTVPADGDVDAPIDGVVMFRGKNLGDGLFVEVTRDGVLVPGTVESLGDRQLWLADAPLDPQTVYEVHAWTDTIGQNIDAYLSFTTGSSSAPSLGVPQIADISVTRYEDVKTKCVAPPEPGSCDDCGEEEITSVEERIMLTVRLAEPPDGPFGAFYRANIRHGVDEQDVADGAAYVGTWWEDPQMELKLTDDLGPVGSWEGDEVCVRASTLDPLGNESEPVVACIPIGDVNVPSPEQPGDTDADPTPEMSDDTDGTDPDDPSAADTPQGTGCACTAFGPAGPGSLPVTLALIALFAPRRRH